MDNDFKTCVVLSDTHGYYELMIRLLHENGITDHEGNWVAGSDVQLVHLGDTVDRGPESARTFLYLRDLQKNLAPGQITRLIGNHEFAYCGGPRFYGADLPEVQNVVDFMVQDGQDGSLGFAYSLTAGDTDWLLVHGGLDNQWHDKVPGLDTPSMAANTLNELGVEFFWNNRPGWPFDATLTPEQRSFQRDLSAKMYILTQISWVRGDRGSLSGVTWCDYRMELLPSEAETRMNQIVGHRAGNEIEFSPGGKFVDVNVQYGTAQLLLIDLETGAMTTSDLLHEN